MPIIIPLAIQVTMHNSREITLVYYALFHVKQYCTPTYIVNNVSCETLYYYTFIFTVALSY